jgi:predicted nucleic acid-binding protein
MNGDYVFDAEAIIAYLYDEPSHEVAADIVNQFFSGETDRVLTEINAN